MSRGLGTVHAVTVVHRAKGLRHSVVLVDLDEGFRLLSSVQGVEPAGVYIDMRVRVRIEAPADPESPPYPVFEPVAKT